MFSLIKSLLTGASGTLAPLFIAISYKQTFCHVTL